MKSLKTKSKIITLFVFLILEEKTINVLLTFSDNRLDLSNNDSYRVVIPSQDIKLTSQQTIDIPFFIFFNQDIEDKGIELNINYGTSHETKVIQLLSP